MNSNNENTRQINGKLKSLKYASSIGIACFKTEAGEITLYGESRMMRPLEDFISQNLVLFIKSEADWNWLPIDENILNLEL